MVSAATWVARANCRGTDPDWWFPATWTARRLADARQICGACPVRQQCLDFAVTHAIREGMWGGLTRSERDEYRIANGIKAVRSYTITKGCGTPAGYQHHLRMGTHICAACTMAESERKQKYAERRRLARIEAREATSNDRTG